MRPTLIVQAPNTWRYSFRGLLRLEIYRNCSSRISVTKINMAEAVGSSINGNMMNDSLSLEKEITRSVFNFIVVQLD